jgi:AcrR family transcriptional regulator
VNFFPKEAPLSNKRPEDPRSVRARQAFHQALQELLKTIPYQRITVTDISVKSGYSRHTFYNHYETKDELLNSVIDGILETYFVNIGPWDSVRRDPDGDSRIGQRFFEVWGDHSDVVRMLNTVDIDHLLISRLTAHFSKYFDEQFNPQEISEASGALISFIVTLLAYSYAGVLRQWLLYDRRYSPEVMGRFLNHFTGKETSTVIEKFKQVIR